MINAPTTLVIAIFAGIAVFAVVGWLRERRRRAKLHSNWMTALADWRQSDAMWMHYCEGLVFEQSDWVQEFLAGLEAEARRSLGRE
jgi:hypothetical protein